MPGQGTYPYITIGNGGRDYLAPGIEAVTVFDKSDARVYGVNRSGQFTTPIVYVGPPGTETDGSILKAGTFGSPIAFSTASQFGIKLFLESTATSGTFVGMRIRTISGATANGQNIESILAQASTADDDNATNVTAIRAEVIAKTASEMAGRVAGIAIKVEDARSTDGTSVAPTYGDRVMGIMIEGQISANPTNGYFGIQFDIQTAGASTAQDLDGLLSILNTAGQNLTIKALLQTGATLAQYGSTSTNMISSGTLTATGSISTSDLKCDARIRFDFGGVSYWAPLYDTAA